MQNNSSIFIVILLAVCAYFYMSSSSVAAPQNVPATPPTLSGQPCYDEASSIVAPDWAGMNRIQRAVLAIQVINECEGGR